jgi:hypothetical protein
VRFDCEAITSIVVSKDSCKVYCIDLQLNVILDKMHSTMQDSDVENA